MYLKTDVDHNSEETFRKKNEFSLFKSHLGDSDDEKNQDLVEPEDDLDDINLNIHLDVLTAGEEYLKIFDDRKHNRAREKQSRKGELLKMMGEIEQMINLIGQDAMVNQMQLFNEKDYDDDDEDLDDEERQKRARSRAMFEEEKRDEKAEEERRKKMQEGWSDRDKNLLEDAKNALKDKLNNLKKDLNKNVLSDIAGMFGDSPNKGQTGANVQEAIASALYDNGDPKSRHNQLIRQIEENPNLSEAEKEQMLRQHYQSLTGIDELMENDRRKQESDLEKAIKERADRRRKALEQKYKKEINTEIKEGEQVIKDEIEARKLEKHKDIDKEIEQKLQEAASIGDKGSYK